MFKTMDQFSSDKYANKFVLRNDGDTMNVIFLYRGRQDILIADAHYIKSADYSGYVHCLHTGCPACQRNIRSQTKLFVPIYSVDTGQILFWERDTKYFLEQFEREVLSRYANPSEYVFSIARIGAYGDRNTRYTITAIGKNSVLHYDKILSDAGISFPEYYSGIIKEMDRSQLALALSPAQNAAASGGYGSFSQLPEFTPQPRVTITPAETPAAPAAVNLDDLPGEDTFEDLPEGDPAF